MIVIIIDLNKKYIDFDISIEEYKNNTLIFSILVDSTKNGIFNINTDITTIKIDIYKILNY